MADLKRMEVKYVRDKAKSNYKKGLMCEICGSAQDLDFHHFYSLTPLFNRWVKLNRLNSQDVVDFRDRFIEEHYDELYLHTATLCHAHHLKLHSIYGKNPALGTASKQAKWVKLQRDKHEKVISDSTSSI
jgi:hypothetical protein